VSRRGQVVLVAAVVVALAFVPVLMAYLQLGYHADVTASEGYTHPTRSGERVLERAVVNASDGVPDDYRWGQRRAAVATVHDRLSPRLEDLKASRVERGTVYRVSYNRSAAAAYAARHCPGGPDRQFGACRAHRGVVVQQRAGETHVLAVAFDLSVTGERRSVAETVVVRVVGGVVRRW
jgi:hypothetical protein